MTAYITYIHSKKESLIYFRSAQNTITFIELLFLLTVCTFSMCKAFPSMIQENYLFNSKYPFSVNGNLVTISSVGFLGKNVLWQISHNAIVPKISHKSIFPPKLASKLIFPHIFFIYLAILDVIAKFDQF